MIDSRQADDIRNSLKVYHILEEELYESLRMFPLEQNILAIFFHELMTFTTSILLAHEETNQDIQCQFPCYGPRVSTLEMPMVFPDKTSHRLSQKKKLLNFYGAFISLFALKKKSYILITLDGSHNLWVNSRLLLNQIFISN